MGLLNTAFARIRPAIDGGRAAVSRACGPLLSFCLPSRCAGCDADEDAAAPACTGCCARLSALEHAPRCGRCAMPVHLEGAPCPFCHGRGIAHIAQVWAMGNYVEPMRRLVLRMKFNARWALAEFFARRAGAMPRLAEMIGQADCIAAVPLHWRRQLVRGYNQSLVFAEALARLPRPGGMAPMRILRPVRRVIDTPSQTTLSATDRAGNVRGAFRLANPAGIAGKRVLLVDDVLTTGATLAAVARQVRRARPASISALVIARTDPNHSDFQAV